MLSGGKVTEPQKKKQLIKKKKHLIYYPFAKYSNNPHYFVFIKVSL